MNKILRNLALAAVIAVPASAFAELAGTGTAADPYIIASAEDLCQGWTLMKTGETVYFVQTEDIDMSKVATTDWHAFGGYENTLYGFIINYDGRNHVIDGFTIKDGAYVAGQNNCYNGSIFGVMSGTIKNLGITNANIDSAQGSGILAAWIGHTAAGAFTSTIENVYVTGAVKTSYYGGGLIGTTQDGAHNVEITNCFALVDVTGTGATRQNAAIIGRANGKATLNYVYAAGTVEAANAAESGLIAGGTAAITANGVVAFNTSESVTTTAKTVTGEITLANTAATKAAGIAAVQGWAGYTDEDIDGYPALGFGMSGEGTAEAPYIIYSADAICEAWKYTKAGETVYFVQTEDIDMEEVEDYHCFVGFDDNTYSSKIVYDGQNHIISNFMPANGTNTDGIHRYDQTVFGVVNGSIKNLGIVDAYISGSDEGAGLLGAYAGHNTGTECTVDNVFVTGEIETSYYGGGMFGTNGNALNISNSFANVKIKGTASNRQIGGIIGRTDKALTLKNVYTAGTIDAAGADIAGLVAGGGAGSVNATDVIAFNTGAAKASVIAPTGTIEVATDATKASLIAKVKGWSAFSATEEVDGYPALNFGGATGGFNDVVVDEAASDAPAVYYNLQGVRVANPANGIFVRVAAGKATKVIK